MQVAFVAFDGMTALDFVGAFDPVTRLETMGYLDLDWEICARRATVAATGDFRIEADAIDRSLESYDLLFVPGGRGVQTHRDDDEFLDWLWTGRGCDLVSSVCTGSLLLGAAGFLSGRRATTHPSYFDDLETYCEVRDDRIVDHDDLITARGVTSSIDLGLHLVERLTDAEVRAEIAARMDYPADR